MVHLTWMAKVYLETSFFSACVWDRPDWNVRHLANPNKLAHLRTVCLRAGYVVPNLVTPEALWTEEESA